MRTICKYVLLWAMLLLSLCLALAACTGGTEPHETQAPSDSSTEVPSDSSTEVPSDESGTEAETTTETAAETATETETQPTETEQEAGVKTYMTLMNDLSQFPITFTYDGTDYRGFGEGFAVTDRQVTREADGEATVLTVVNPAINAVFEIHGKQYPAYSAYEYYVVIRNESDTDTKVIDNLMFEVHFAGEQAVLSGIDGDAGSSWYEPYEQKLTQRWYKKESTSGRPSHGVFPYFNLQHGDGGTFIALGWPGRWKAHFKSDGTDTTVLAGQYDFSSYLKPGESARTPLMAYVEYEGHDEDVATKAWRDWMVDCNMPTINDGERIPTLLHTLTISDGWNTPMFKLMASEFFRHGIQLDAFWADAGWYYGIGEETVSWPQTGSLRVDTKRFPDRLTGINKLMKSRNGGLILWFEPEVVRLDRTAFLADNPDFKEEWLMGRVSQGTWLEGEIIDLGNPEAVDWILGRVTKVIDDAGGILVYRQDFNCDPADAWIAHESTGRVGMSENQYVCGYLSYWDALLARYPGMFIDSCASGGGRNDLETLRRAVAMQYSDYFDGEITPAHEGMKLGMTTELFKWFPYVKNWVTSSDSKIYQCRLNYSHALGFRFGDGTEEMWSLYKQAADEYELIRENFYGDYYALTESSKKLGTWTAWEFYDPARGEGHLQFFRTQGTPTESLTVKLKGLDPDATYSLKDTDGLIDITSTGAELMESFTVTLTEAPGSSVILVKKVA